MLIHSVFFWNKPASSAEDAAFLAGLQGLLAIPDIQQGFVGPPAATRDAVIDHSYDFGLTLLFADQAAHDRYQVDPRHLAFIKQFEYRFAKVRVFDMEG